MKKAFSLSITLWISAVLMAISVYFIYVAKTNLKNSISLNTKLNMYIKSKSTLEQLKFYIGSGEFKNYTVSNNLKGFPNQLYLDSTPQEINNTTIILQDTSGLVNIMYPNFTLIQKLADINNTKATLIPSLKDWLDLDSYTLENGAEESYYLSKGYNYTPRNSGFLVYKDELLDIRDWNNSYDKIKKYLVYTNIGGYNFTTMPNLLLKLKYNLDDNTIKELNKLKKENNIKKYLSLFYQNAQNLNIDGDTAFPSRSVIIKVISSENNISSQLQQTIDFNSLNIVN